MHTGLARAVSGRPLGHSAVTTRPGTSWHHPTSAVSAARAAGETAATGPATAAAGASASPASRRQQRAPTTLGDTKDLFAAPYPFFFRPLVTFARNCSKRALASVLPMRRTPAKAANWALRGRDFPCSQL
jgi:hypothetical protein